MAQSMRWQGFARSCAAMCLLSVLLIAGCSAGNNGGLAIAFLRGGELWSIQPDGSALLQLTSPSTIGFAWSPDHHQIVARFASQSSTAIANPVIGSTGDVLSALGVLSVDGGVVLPITPSQTLLRSDGWWDAAGNRLIYREDSGNLQQWVLSQADQPSGIARKIISQQISIPSVNADASRIATIAADGDLFTGTPDAAGIIMQHGVLASIATADAVWPLRPEWQPLHNDVLFASPSGDATTVTLATTDLSGKMTPVTTAENLEDYSWSPDGTKILVRTSQGFQIVTTSGAQVVSWPEADSGAVAWWSPDSRYMMTQDLTTLRLARVATHDVKTLATWTASSTSVAPPKSAGAWHVVTGSPWSASGDQFALGSPGGTWQGGAKLATAKGPGTGIYIIAADSLTSTAPRLIDWGQHFALSWSTPDPNTQLVTP